MRMITRTRPSTHAEAGSAKSGCSHHQPPPPRTKTMTRIMIRIRLIVLALVRLLSAAAPPPAIRPARPYLRMIPIVAGSNTTLLRLPSPAPRLPLRRGSGCRGCPPVGAPAMRQHLAPSICREPADTLRQYRGCCIIRYHPMRVLPRQVRPRLLTSTGEVAAFKDRLARRPVSPGSQDQTCRE